MVSGCQRKSWPNLGLTLSKTQRTATRINMVLLRTTLCDWELRVPLLIPSCDRERQIYNQELFSSKQFENNCLLKKEAPGGRFVFITKLVMSLPSTMHNTKQEGANNKAEIINIYNLAKRDVDAFDQMVHTYSVWAKTRRRSMRFFVVFWFKQVYILEYVPNVKMW